MARASDILAVAAREIGTVEQPGNRQKYGKAYGVDGVYWCMQFVWWVFQQVDKQLFMAGGRTASCGELMRWAQRNGQWVTHDFRPGDVLIYNFPGTDVQTDHTGICESVSGDTVTAIEGNTSSGAKGSQDNGDGVYRKTRKRSLVLGAYRPKYDAEPARERDNVPAAWARESVEWAIAAGLIKGDAAGDLKLRDSITREQAVVLLHRLWMLLR